MNIMELGAIGELVGGVAVVGSLLFVGFQVRQVRKATRADASDKTWESWRDISLIAADNIEVFRDGLFDFRNMGGPEKMRFVYLISPFFNYWENYHAKYREGLIDGVEWTRLNALMHWYLGCPAMPDVWPRVEGILTAPFAEHVREVLRDFEEGRRDRSDYSDFEGAPWLPNASGEGR